MSGPINLGSLAPKGGFDRLWTEIRNLKIAVAQLTTANPIQALANAAVSPTVLAVPQGALISGVAQSDALNHTPVQQVVSVPAGYTRALILATATMTGVYTEQTAGYVGYMRMAGFVTGGTLVAGVAPIHEEAFNIEDVCTSDATFIAQMSNLPTSLTIGFKGAPCDTLGGTTWGQGSGASVAASMTGLVLFLR